MVNHDVIIGKTTIASAITNKGVNTSPDDSFNTMANNINNIQTTNGYIFTTNSLIDKDYYSYTPNGSNQTYISTTKDNYTAKVETMKTIQLPSSVTFRKLSAFFLYFSSKGSGYTNIQWHKTDYNSITMMGNYASPSIRTYTDSIIDSNYIPIWPNSNF